MKKILLSGVALCFILLSSICFISNAEEKESTLPFSVENTDFGIKDTAVTGEKITIIDENVEILSQPLLNLDYGNSYLHQDLGFVFLRKTNGETARYYLITANGCVDQFEAQADYKPEISLLLAPYCGEKFGNGRYQYPYSLYSVYQPETGKYNIINSTTGEYFDCQLKDIEILPDKGNNEWIEFISDGKYGLIDKSGKILHEALYYRIDHYEGFCMGYVEGKGYIYLGPDGEQGTEYYDQTGAESDGIISVCGSKGWGILSGKTGELLLDCENREVLEPENGYFAVYNRVYDEDTGNYYNKTWIVSEEGAWDINDTQGGSYAQVGETDSTDEGIFDGKMKVTIWGSVQLQENSNEKYRPVIFKGFIDVDGNVVSDFTNDTDEYNNSNFVLRHRYYNNLLLNEHEDQRGETYGYYLTDKTGGIVLDHISEGVTVSGNRFVIAHQEDGMLLYDCQKQEVLFDKMSYIEPFALEGRGILLVNNENDSRFGIYDTETEQFSDYIFDYSDDNFSGLKEYISENGVLWEYKDSNNNYMYINGQFDVVNQGENATVDSQLNIIIDTHEPYQQTNYYQYHRKVIGIDGQMVADFAYETEALDVNAPCVTREAPDVNHYGLVTSLGKEILPQEYTYIGRNWHGLSFVQGDTTGVVNSTGQFVLQEKYDSTPFYLDSADLMQSGTIILADAENSSVIYLYNFEEFMQMDDENDTDQLKIIESYPAAGAEGVNLSLTNDIRITFNKNVNIFNDRPGDQLGSVQIKEYDTDKTVLEYNMLTGSKVGQIVYLDGTKGKDTILLKNAMTVLDRGKKYYVLMDDYCVAEEGDTHNPVWFQGITDKDELSFKIGANTQVLSDITYLAACSLARNDLIEFEGKTVEEYVNSDSFSDNVIWEKDTATYGSFYKELLGGYEIKSAKGAAGYIVLAEESSKKVILVYKNVDESAINEMYFVNSFENYLNIKGEYEGYDVVVTGESGAGVCAAYVSALDNENAITFNAPIGIGLDLAFKNNVGAITEYSGINNVPCKNYGTASVLNFFTGMKNANYNDIELVDNPYGDWGNLNQLFEREDNFQLTNVRRERKAEFFTKTFMSDTDYFNIVKSVVSSLKNCDPLGMLTGMISGGQEVIFGSNDSDFWRPTSLRTQIVYTGGCTTAGEDIFYGSGKGNFFNYSGENAHIYGSSGQDMYFINGDEGTVTISDYTDTSFMANQIEGILSSFQQFNAQELKKRVSGVVSMASILDAFDTGMDTVFINTGEVFRENIIETEQFYQLTIGNCTIKIQRRNSPVKVVGLNNTEIILGAYGINEDVATFSAKASEFSQTNDYSVRGLLLYGNNIAYDLYADNQIVESGNTSNGTEVGDYHYIVTQNENEAYWINVSDEVEKLVITGGNLEKAEVVSLSDYALNYEFDLAEIAGKITVDYTENSIFSTETGKSLVGEEKQFEVTDVENMDSSLVVLPPEKIDYIPGEELDLTGIKVYVCVPGSEITEIEDYVIEGYDNSKIGSQELTVKSEQGECTFSVIVHEEGSVISSIEVAEEFVLSIGEIQSLNIGITPENINDSELVITSSDESIVKVRGSYIEGVSAGTAVITISDKYGRIQRECNITVSEGDVLGDVTGDGQVQIDDLRLIHRFVCQRTTLTEAQKQVADVNRDGEVDVTDVQSILRFVCGKIDEL